MSEREHEVYVAPDGELAIRRRKVASPSLDVERLARALEKVRDSDSDENGDSPLWQYDERRLAASIARAYAEDQG